MRRCPALAPGTALAAALTWGAVPASGQVPASPTHRAVEVRYRAGPDTPLLAGTLTLPRGEGPFPAAVLLGVAGPDDRNQTLPRGGEPFRVLAEDLAGRGVATLRSDDRGVGASGGDLFETGLDGLVADAAAAVDLLASRPEIEPAAIGLIGNSEGALVAAEAGSRTGTVAFVVLLAAPGKRGAEVIADRAGLRGERIGAGEDRIESLRSRLATLAELVEERPPDARARIRSMMRDGPLLPPYRFVPRGREERIDFLLSPWYRSQLLSDPRPALSALEAPVLALTGSADRINPASRNLPAIQRALLDGGNPDHTVAVLPGLDHFMRPGGGAGADGRPGAEARPAPEEAGGPERSPGRHAPRHPPWRSRPSPSGRSPTGSGPASPRRRAPSGRLPGPRPRAPGAPAPREEARRTPLPPSPPRRPPSPRPGAADR